VCVCARACVCAHIGCACVLLDQVISRVHSQNEISRHTKKGSRGKRHSSVAHGPQFEIQLNVDRLIFFVSVLLAVCCFCFLN